MIDKNVLEKMRERYSHLHPLIFHRSVERCKSAVDLFDILESIPKTYPIVWDEQNHCWIEATTAANDLLQSATYFQKNK